MKSSGKKLVLVADNAAYHHKREIGSIGSLTKKKLIELMEKYEVEHIDLPLTDSRWNYLQEHQEDQEHINDHGDCIQIPFDPEEQKQVASQSKTTSWKCTRTQGCTAYLPQRRKT